MTVTDAVYGIIPETAWWTFVYQPFDSSFNIQIARTRFKYEQFVIEVMCLFKK